MYRRSFDRDQPDGWLQEVPFSYQTRQFPEKGATKKVCLRTKYPGQHLLLDSTHVVALPAT